MIILFTFTFVMASKQMLFKFIFYKYMLGIFLHMFISHFLVFTEAEEDIGPASIKSRDNCEPLYRCRGANPGPL